METLVSGMLLSSGVTANSKQIERPRAIGSALVEWCHQQEKKSSSSKTSLFSGLVKMTNFKSFSWSLRKQAAIVCVTWRQRLRLNKWQSASLPLFYSTLESSQLVSHSLKGVGRVGCFFGHFRKSLLMSSLEATL